MSTRPSSCATATSPKNSCRTRPSPTPWRSAAKADILFAGVGGRNDRIDYAGQGYLGPAEWQELVAAGMEGDICARFFDRNGRAINHKLRRRVIGLGLDELQRMPSRVIAAGGPSKLDAIRAVLRRELATVLITDADAPASLMKTV